MTGRNKRVNRRASLRAKVAVTAAALAGTGAAAAVAVALTTGGATSAQSAGYVSSSHHMLSESTALPRSMHQWPLSTTVALTTLSQMAPMRTFNTFQYHTHTVAAQRGTIVATARNEFVLRSVNNKLELWHLSHGTAVLNVGPSKMGMAAMMGNGSMSMPWQWQQMNMHTKGLQAGDLAFVFGQKVHGKLIAQLVLFVAPLRVTTPVTPTAMPTTTMTGTPSMTATPAATATTPVVAPTPTSTSPTFTGTNS